MGIVMAGIVCEKTATVCASRLGPIPFYQRILTAGYRPHSNILSGWTVSRRAISVEPSKTSRTWLQSRQRNSPLVPFLETNSIRR
jgi:hypothetical protein